MRGKSAEAILDPLDLRAGMAVPGPCNDVGYRPDEPSPAFDGRFVRLKAVNPTIVQRLFGG